MFAQSVVRTADGAIAVAADLSRKFGARDHALTGLWFSRDEGGSWTYAAGQIPGVHATFVQLKDGRLMALARGEDVNGWMPLSYSSDMGRSWQTSASIFPPIIGGQRAVLLRLKEGPIVLVSFARDVRKFEPLPHGRDIRWTTSMFAAVSFDEGRTWPLRRVISDNKPDHAVFTMDLGRVRMSPIRSEPQGYLAITQTRDGVIHLLSSINHYAFNLAWLKQPQADIPLEPRPITLERRADLGQAADGTDGVSTLHPEKGFTVEARVRVTGEQHGFELRAFSVSGPRLLNRYAIGITASSVEYWDGTRWNRIRAHLHNAGSTHTFRMAVRPDTAVQVYRDEELLATLDPDLGNDLAQASRGSHFEWGGGNGTAIESVRFDGGGAFQP
jgi:hypothetical protein